ncbi:hypothetical protein G5V57_14370 [Nordella sp. HKS 07]|uniref:hypothetical protein n=1 Tax=Nordella sp. HKS 07 TaxID=2712222 RepID=UPI0013E1A80A|nr:hypothetical protein [Nordella sp. HKS 07]QIG48808.1 hypothetical protein G5V57_14370 [Nordella sp. HKS 07]
MAKKNKTRESWDATPSQPFVAVLKPMLQEPAWLAMSYGARCLYITLKSFYNGSNNGNIFLGVRKAATLLGAVQSSTERWFRELQDHGFIRQTQGAFLGTDGHASATYWRLTEIGYRGERPTRDYQQWEPRKNKTPPRKSGQIVPKIGTPRTENEDTRPENEDGFGPNSLSDRLENRCISIIPSTRGLSSEPTSLNMTGPSVAGVSAPPNGAEANPPVARLLATPFLKVSANGKTAE